jgi:hypothetical protein
MNLVKIQKLFNAVRRVIKKTYFYTSVYLLLLYLTAIYKDLTFCWQADKKYYKNH